MASAPRPHSRAAAFGCLFYLAIAVALGVWVARHFKSPERRAMESLAEFVLARGDAATMPIEPLKYFGLPFDDRTFFEMRATSGSGRTRGVFVRKRADSGMLDIFFVHLLPNDTRGYFYLTSTHGRLTKAAFFDDSPKPPDDAAERFRKELEFWKLWRRERLAAKGN